MTPVVRLLLFATIGAFFIQMTVPLFYPLFVFVPQYVLIRPWTLVTYMFLHAPGLMHIGFNMLALFFFGPRVEERIGSRRFAVLYFLSGVTGALLSLFFTPQAQIVGASAGVFGVMLAFAYFWPHAPIHIWGVLPIPARVLVIITTIFSIYAGIQGTGRVAHFAHLGGYLGAFLYLKWIERGKQQFKRKATAAPRVATHDADRLRRIDLSAVHELNREEVNRLLDKISANGVASLTPQERIFLSNFAPLDDRVPPKS